MFEILTLNFVEDQKTGFQCAFYNFLSAITFIFFWSSNKFEVGLWNFLLFRGVKTKKKVFNVVVTLFLAFFGLCLRHDFGVAVHQKLFLTGFDSKGFIGKKV